MWRKDKSWPFLPPQGPQQGWSLRQPRWCLDGTSNKVGVETGYGWNLNRDFSTTSPGAACDVVAPFVCEGRINNIWQIGPRLGVAFDRFMLYGTGGYAQGSITSRIRNTATFDTDSQPGPVFVSRARTPTKFRKLSANEPEAALMSRLMVPI
jgi:hypothetical protein